MGSRVLGEGGNAIDAAVATALALAVSYPQAGNLGGGGFMLIHRPDGQVHFLDFRETAPRGITTHHLISNAAADSSRVGALAVGVPGTVAGLALALERFGTWKWERVTQPAIELAENGTWLTTRQAAYFDLFNDQLSRYESTRRVFSHEGKPLQPGRLLRQRDLAQTLRVLAEDGPMSFYTGRVAKQLAATIRAERGVLDEEDLANYRPQWREPIVTDFCGRQVVTAGLPSGGGMIVQISLALLQSSGALSMAPGSTERLDLMGRTFRVAFALMREHAGDPDHMSAEQHHEFSVLLNRVRTEPDLQQFESEVLDPRPRPDHFGDSKNTTHFSLLDSAGNAVSLTFSLNTLFGSKLMVDGGGYLLNNCLDDFLLAPNAPNWYDLVPGERNLLQPGRRPVSSMSPTVVRSGLEAELIVGGSGGPRIPTMLTQLIVGTIADGLSLEQAIQKPRVHHQYLPEELAIENAMPEAVTSGLSARWSKRCMLPQLGIGVGIQRRPATGKLSLSLDSRFSFE